METQASPIVHTSPGLDPGLSIEPKTSGCGCPRDLLGWTQSPVGELSEVQLGSDGLRRRGPRRARGAWRRVGRRLSRWDGVSFGIAPRARRRARGGGSRKFYRGRGRIDFLILEIERSWGQEPGWFNGLGQQTQADLFGWQRVHMMPQKKKPQSARERALRSSGVSGSDDAMKWLSDD